MSSFTVIVPALNEEDNLRPTVEAVLEEFGVRSEFLEVLIFDDASTDRTGEVAEKLAIEDPRVRVFHNARPLNIGGIYKAGVRHARGRWIFLVPGDNEMRVEEITRGFEFLDRAPLVVFHVTNPQVRSHGRQLLSRLYVHIVNALFGTRFRYTNGTNIFRTDVVRTLPIVTDGFSYQTEAVVKAIRSGVDFAEVGLEIQVRASGVSKAVTWKNFKSVGAALARLWWDVQVRNRSRYRRRGQRVT